MKRYRAGVVGVGFIGVAHIEALRRLGNVDVVAIADPMEAEQKAENLGVPHAYADYKEMLEEESLDVLHICTPNYTHCDIALYAMTRNLHIVCEKPLCRTLEEADRMISYAKEKGLLNGVNYHNRWYPMTAQLRKMVAEGEFGEIHAVYGEFVQDWLLYDTDYNWRVEASQSGRTKAVADIGTHWLDLVEYITGLNIAEVCADFKILHETRKKPKPNAEASARTDGPAYEEVKVTTEDHANVLFRLSNGAVGSAVFSEIFPGRKTKIALNFAGTKQSASWCSDMCNEVWLGRRGRFNSVFEKDPGTLDPSVRINAGYPGGHAEGFPDAFKNCFRAMYASIESPVKTPPYATFETGRRELLLCERIWESAQKRQWVAVE